MILLLCIVLNILCIIVHHNLHFVPFSLQLYVFFHYAVYCIVLYCSVLYCVIVVCRNVECCGVMYLGNHITVSRTAHAVVH